MIKLTTMKNIKILLLIVIVGTVSFIAGRTYESKFGKAQEDASKMSDLIRCYNDVASDSTFFDIQNDFLEGVNVGDYAYCY